MKKRLAIFLVLIFAANVFACAAITKKGTRCKRAPVPGSEYCWQHGGRSYSGGNGGIGSRSGSGSKSSSKGLWLGLLFGVPATLFAAGWTISKINDYRENRAREKAKEDKKDEDVLSRILDFDLLSDAEKVKIAKVMNNERKS